MIIVTGNAPAEEQQAYIDYIQEKHHRKLESIDIQIDEDDYANISYKFSPVKFERIRRITGYLVGTMDHWNNAKQAEEADRVKHQA